jgi:hypothetical protein
VETPLGLIATTPRVAVDGARIPEGEDDEPCAAKRHVRLEDALAQLCVLH